MNPGKETYEEGIKRIQRVLWKYKAQRVSFEEAENLWRNTCRAYGKTTSWTVPEGSRITGLIEMAPGFTNYPDWKKASE